MPPPASARQMDPLLREREEFKAAMLAQRFQHMLQKNAVSNPGPRPCKGSQQSGRLAAGFHPERWSCLLMHRGAEVRRDCSQPEMPPPVVPAPVSKSEPDWSHVAYAKDADAMSAGSSQVMTPFASVGVPGTDDDSEWARIMQQREDDRRVCPCLPSHATRGVPDTHAQCMKPDTIVDVVDSSDMMAGRTATPIVSTRARQQLRKKYPPLQEAHFRRSRSPIPNRAQPFGHPGQFRGVPASGHAGGPFAAAAAAAGMPPPSAGIHRSTSHSSLSQQTSGGALDRSAGSTFSHPDEVSRTEPSPLCAFRICGQLDKGPVVQRSGAHDWSLVQGQREASRQVPESAPWSST